MGFSRWMRAIAPFVSLHQSQEQSMKKWSLICSSLFCLGATLIASSFEVSAAAKPLDVIVQDQPFLIKATDPAGKTIFRIVDGVQLQTVRGSKPRESSYWLRWSDGKKESSQIANVVLGVTRVSGMTRVALGTSLTSQPVASLTIRQITPEVVRIEISAVDKSVNRIKANIFATKSERFFGMGMRFDNAEHKNKKVTVWAREVGKNLPGIEADGGQEGRDTTYFPVPFFLSSQNYGLLLDDTHYSEFDFQRERLDVVSVTNYNHTMPLMFFYGKTPLEIISRQTKFTGRIPRVPPPWVFGNWAAAIKGSNQARKVAKTLREKQIPTSAIMIEDWWWTLGFPARSIWTVNRGTYPDYEGLLKDLKNQGFRNIGYFHPYITTRSSTYLSADRHWLAADKARLFTQTEQGKSYRIPFFIWKVSQLDWSNPSATEWFNERFLKVATDLYGVDGWMHDFGEYTPFDSLSHNGMSGAQMHNLYPLLWAKQGYDFWQRQRPNGDYVFFTRSGYTGLQKYAPLYFTGDRNATDKPLSGLGGQIPGLLSAGISGHPIGAMDIGAYNCEKTRPTGKELFMRWVEMGALTPVMRTHRGLYPLCKHWDFQRDAETLEHYKKYAVLHVSLVPYFYTLAHEAQRTGWPIMRHLFLHYPNDPQTALHPYEFLVGNRILVAPVIKLKKNTQQVYLPEGRWYHWWSGRTYQGSAQVEVAAPIGELPLFILEGRIVPFFDSRIDTLVSKQDSGLAGWEAANASMKLVFIGSGKDRLNLWDGTQLSCERQKDKVGRCLVRGGPQRRYTFEFR